jgi:hypothetical protein
MSVAEYQHDAIWFGGARNGVAGRLSGGRSSGFWQRRRPPLPTPDAIGC